MEHPLVISTQLFRELKARRIWNGIGLEPVYHPETEVAGFLSEAIRSFSGDFGSGTSELVADHLLRCRALARISHRVS